MGTDGVVARVLRDLRITVEQRGNELWAPCPQHRARTGKDDANPSWSINAVTGVMYCFSCQYSGGLYTLVRDLEGEDRAKEYRSLVADESRVGTFHKGDVKRNLRRLTAHRGPQGPVGVPESHLAVFSPEVPAEALQRRHLWQRSVDAYRVMWDRRGGAWVLPFFHPDGHMVGYQLKWEGQRRFRNVPMSMEKSSTLFGIQVAASHPVVVVVESPLDAVRVHGMGCPSVAVGGSKVSDEQLKILSGFDMVTFSLDNDEAGQREHKRLRSLTREYGILASYVTSPNHKDPGDMPDRVIHDLFWDSIHVQA